MFEVLEPLNVLRLVVEAPDQGLRADLTFVRRSAPIEEDHFRQQIGLRVTFDYTRLTQFGGWEGWIEVDGELTDLAPGETVGSRDRSWGVRRSANADRPGLRSPTRSSSGCGRQLNFDTFSTHFDVNEYFDGKRWHESGFVAPISDPEGSHPAVAMRSVDYEITWRPGTRTASSFELEMTPWDGEASTIRLEPLFEFHMSGLGYLCPSGPHGVWKGELAVGGERWELPVDDPVAPHNVHVQSIVRATTSGGLGDHTGLGVLEQLAIGRHDPTGLEGIFDGFAG